MQLYVKTQHIEFLWLIFQKVPRLSKCDLDTFQFRQVLYWLGHALNAVMDRQKLISSLSIINFNIFKIFTLTATDRKNINLFK